MLIGISVLVSNLVDGSQSLVFPSVIAAVLFYPGMEAIALGQASLVLALESALFLRCIGFLA
jgi:hypothetical protein